MFRKSEFIRLRFHDFQRITSMDLLTPFLIFQHHFTKLMQKLFLHITFFDSQLIQQILILVDIT